MKKNVIVSIVIVAFIFVTGAMFDTAAFSCFVSAAASVFDTGVKIWSYLKQAEGSVRQDTPQIINNYYNIQCVMYIQNPTGQSDIIQADQSYYVHIKLLERGYHLHCANFSDSFFIHYNFHLSYSFYRMKKGGILTNE